MADLLDHPKKNCDWTTEKFELLDGTVIISVPKGEELTLAKSLFLLEMVKTRIMKLALR